MRTDGRSERRERVAGQNFDEGRKNTTKEGAGQKMHVRPSVPSVRPPNIIGVIRFDSPGVEREGKEGRRRFLSLPLLQQSFVVSERRSRKEFCMPPRLLPEFILVWVSIRMGTMALGRRGWKTPDGDSEFISTGSVSPSYILGQTKRFLRGCENFLPALA